MSCNIVNPEAFDEPGKRRLLAKWLVEFGIRVGTIKNPVEGEDKNEDSN